MWLHIQLQSAAACSAVWQCERSLWHVWHLMLLAQTCSLGMRLYEPVLSIAQPAFQLLCASGSQGCARLQLSLGCLQWSAIQNGQHNFT